MLFYLNETHLLIVVTEYRLANDQDTLYPTYDVDQSYCQGNTSILDIALRVAAMWYNAITTAGACNARPMQWSNSDITLVCIVLLIQNQLTHP